MEIERKYLVKTLPDHLDQYESKKIAQGYLCTEPVVRIRRSNDDYYLTYKGDGLMVREEYNLPLTKVEFDSVEEAEQFTAPDWFGEDVTNSGKYHNSYLSRHGLR